ncbi:hypothetical protein N9W84_00925 [bacterium]|nr:hypothetical protein [bacterium]
MNYLSTNANLSFSDSKFLEAVGLLEEVFSFKYDNNYYKMEVEDSNEIVEVKNNCIKLNICFNFMGSENTRKIDKIFDLSDAHTFFKRFEGNEYSTNIFFNGESVVFDEIPSIHLGEKAGELLYAGENMIDVEDAKVLISKIFDCHKLCSNNLNREFIFNSCKDFLKHFSSIRKISKEEYEVQSEKFREACAEEEALYFKDNSESRKEDHEDNDFPFDLF